MKDDLVIETGLSRDSYDSIAFKGNSAQYLSGVMAEVFQMAEKGTIYPPAFATWRNPELEYGISLRPHNQDDGRLSPAEAVAIKVMADEGSAMAQNLFKSMDKNKLISEIVGNPDGWPSDIVDGMADFGYNLCGAISIRERIARGETIPTGRTIKDDLDRPLWQMYQAPLKLDGMVIKGNTVAAITKFVNELVEKEIRGVPNGLKMKKNFRIG